MQAASVAGVEIAVVEAGIRYRQRRDLVLMRLCEGAQTAAVFTRNRFCAAPVQVARAHLESGHAVRYLLVNTGNANAGTGDGGLDDARTSCQRVAELAGESFESILPFSTGVIGERLPMERLLAGIEVAYARLGTANLMDAAAGIMTTDTRPKLASAQVDFAGRMVTIAGIAKGAGMIHPNMATMLGYVFTDAHIEAAELQSLLRAAADRSFNRITIDGDTSTNDAVVLVATGRSGCRLDSQYRDAFVDALNEVMLSLSHQIVRDGEGATKFVTIRVEQAATRKEAADCAFTIAHSPLVKTALFASDPNWGRILAAVGRAPIDNLDVSRIHIFLDDVCVVSNGGLDAGYTEARGAAVMRQGDITITVQLGRGNASDTVWTTDFSFDYVKINAEYRS